MDDGAIFSLFEGMCPSCGGEVEITGVGGTSDFLEQYWSENDSKIEPRVWSDRLVDTQIGEFDWTCKQCGQDFTVVCNIWGDWN